jgi:hypothetical protein
MRFLHRQYLIYPEVQLPLVRNVLITLMIVSTIQILGIYFSMQWLQNLTRVKLDILVDQRVLGTWKNFLFLSILIPIIINALLSIFIVLVISNKFAGPIYRLEKEIREVLNKERPLLNVKLRKDDYLKRLADMVNELDRRERPERSEKFPSTGEQKT